MSNKKMPKSPSRIISKDRSRGELEKLKALSFKEKIEYIWHYYNYFIIGGVVAVIVIVSMLNTYLFSPQTQLFIYWENPYVTDERLDALSSDLSARLFDENSRDVAAATYFFPVGADNMATNMQYLERLVAMITANAIDIFILDAEGLSGYAFTNFVLPLEDILEQIKLQNPAAHERMMAFAVTETFDNFDEPETENIAGIRVDNSPLYRKLGLPDQSEVYLAVCVSTERRDNIVAAIIEFFAEEP